MDRFPITVGPNGDVAVSTGTIVTGPPIGTNTTGQEAEGPHCITERWCTLIVAGHDDHRLHPPGGRHRRLDHLR